MADITNSGFIKLHRKMLEWEWYTDTNVKVVFIHCLLKANFTQKNWRGITIERGSFITSYANLARELNLSVKQVRLAIEKLKRTGELAIKTTNKYSIITIKNYDEYQSQGIQEDKQEDTQKANKGQTKGKQRATTKNDKNEKNDKNDKKYNIMLSQDFKEIVSDVDDDLKPAILDFIEHRKKMKSPFTPKALKLMLNKLNNLAHDNTTKKAIIDQSIMMGWKGVFPLKNGSANGRKRNGFEVSTPDWLDDHERYRQSVKEESAPVDPEQVKSLLSRFQN